MERRGTAPLLPEPAAPNYALRCQPRGVTFSRCPGWAFSLQRPGLAQKKGRPAVGGPGEAGRPRGRRRRPSPFPASPGRCRKSGDCPEGGRAGVFPASRCKFPKEPFPFRGEDAQAAPSPPSPRGPSAASPPGQSQRAGPATPPPSADAKPSPSPPAPAPPGPFLPRASGSAPPGLRRRFPGREAEGRPPRGASALLHPAFNGASRHALRGQVCRKGLREVEFPRCSALASPKTAFTFAWFG